MFFSNSNNNGMGNLGAGSLGVGGLIPVLATAIIGYQALPDDLKATVADAPALFQSIPSLHGMDLSVPNAAAKTLFKAVTGQKVQPQQVEAPPQPVVLPDCGTGFRIITARGPSCNQSSQSERVVDNERMHEDIAMLESYMPEDRLVNGAVSIQQMRAIEVSAE